MITLQKLRLIRLIYQVCASYESQAAVDRLPPVVLDSFMSSQVALGAAVCGGYPIMREQRRLHVVSRASYEAEARLEKSVLVRPVCCAPLALLAVWLYPLTRLVSVLRVGWLRWRHPQVAACGSLSGWTSTVCEPFTQFCGSKRLGLRVTPLLVKRGLHPPWRASCYGAKEADTRSMDTVCLPLCVCASVVLVRSRDVFL